MKRIIFFLLFSTLFAKNIPFSVGEKFTYEFRFNIFKAGTASLEITDIDTIDGAPTYKIQFIATTDSWGNFVFPIRDTVSIWIDQNLLATRKIAKNINEGNYHKVTQTHIYTDKGFAISNQDTVFISSAVQDPYSLFYILRTFALRVGDNYHFTTIDGKKLTDIHLELEKKTRIKVVQQWWNCLKVRPFRSDGQALKNLGEMAIWFSDDANKYPVRIKIKLKYGALTLNVLDINSTNAPHH